jgi:hypothetical protein
MASLMPAAVCSAAQTKLLKVASDHFEVYTTDNEAAAKAAIEHFETARAYLLKSTNSQDPFNKPVRIFGFKSHADFASSLPKGVAAENAYSGSDEGGAFILMDGINKDTYEYGMRQYVDLLFVRVAPKMPFWLRLGFAQLYATMRTGNGAVVIGTEPHVSYRAGSSPTLSASTMSLVMGLKPGDVAGGDKQASAFAASNNNSALPQGTQGMDTIAEGLTQDYSRTALHLVRMLMFSKTYGPKFGAFVGAVAEGANSASTFNSVYGQSMTGLAQDLAMDWKQPSHPVLTLKFEMANPVEPRTTQLSADESAAVLTQIKNSK